MNGLSTTAQAISEVITINQTSIVSFEIAWTTSVATGTFVVQGSVTGNNWNNIEPLSSTPTMAATNATWLLSLSVLGPLLVRLVFNPTIAGAGTINAWVGGKAA